MRSSRFDPPRSPRRVGGKICGVFAFRCRGDVYIAHLTEHPMLGGRGKPRPYDGYAEIDEIARINGVG